MTRREPSLACVILAVRDPPGLVDAVRSILDQDVPVETVVVNSGGGDPESTLLAAGLAVKVISRPELLYPGGARNLGIDHTRAPIVAFLASDCLALPGWARTRIEAHAAGALVVSSSVCNRDPDNLNAVASHVLLHSRRMERAPSDDWRHFGCSYHRSLFHRFGPFRDDIRISEDHELNDLLLRAGIEVVARPEVRTAHQYETSWPGLLADHFRRGQRRTRHVVAVRRKAARMHLVRHTLGQVPRTIQRAWRASDDAQRRRLLQAAPRIVAGVLAGVCGSLLDQGPATRAYRKRSRRIVALLQFRNEIKYLPEWFANVAPQVDAVIALDDGSTDGSAELVGRHAAVTELLRKPPGPDPVHHEIANQRLLISAAGRHAADWIIVVDADERLERHFRVRAVDEIARAEREQSQAFSIRYRELWDSPETFRSDGIWGQKVRAHFFQWRPDHQFDPRELHGHWAPLNSRTRSGGFPRADLIKYHLRMVHPEDRQARRAKFEASDPTHRWQPRGYAYLTDTQGLRLDRPEPGRDYLPP